MLTMNPLIPLVAYADDSSLSVKQLVYKISYNVLNPLITLGFAIALLYFTWTVIEYIRDRNSGTIIKDKDTSSSANRVAWGLFGLFIMVSAFGIMRLMKGLIGSDIATP